MLSYLYYFKYFFYAKNVCLFCSDNLRWNQTWFTLICCIAISRMLLLTWGTRLVTGTVCQSSPPKPQTTSHNPLPHHQAVVVPPSPVFWVWQMCLYMREPCSFPLRVFRLIFAIPSFIRHVCATSHGPLCFASWPSEIRGCEHSDPLPLCLLALDWLILVLFPNRERLFVPQYPGVTRPWGTAILLGLNSQLAQTSGNLGKATVSN